MSIKQLLSKVPFSFLHGGSKPKTSCKLMLQYLWFVYMIYSASKYSLCFDRRRIHLRVIVNKKSVYKVGQCCIKEHVYPAVILWDVWSSSLIGLWPRLHSLRTSVTSLQVEFHNLIKSVKQSSDSGGCQPGWKGTLWAFYKAGVCQYALQWAGFGYISRNKPWAFIKRILMMKHKEHQSILTVQIHHFSGHHPALWWEASTCSAEGEARGDAPRPAWGVPSAPGASG